LLVHGEKEGFAVRDLKSVNGTFVNGERLDRCHLRTGDRIIAGETTLLVLLREDGSDPHQSDGLRFSEVLEPKLSPRVEDKVLPTTRKLGFQVFSSNS
jgi:pSer/pThr/pTyr-binding forkhead associated (FHA) protein